MRHAKWLGAVVAAQALFLLGWAALVLLWVFVMGGLLAGVGSAASTGIAA